MDCLRSRARLAPASRGDRVFRNDQRPWGAARALSRLPASVAARLRLIQFRTYLRPVPKASWKIFDTVEFGSWRVFDGVQEAPADEVFATAVRDGFEGVVVKKLAAPYAAGRRDSMSVSPPPPTT